MNRMDEAELGAMTVDEFCGKYRIGRTKFYEEINAGRLRAVKCGTRTLVLNRDSRTWERLLPSVCSLRLDHQRN
jgi:excisionase family DNA binding protein